MLDSKDKKSLAFIKATDTNVLMHNVDERGVPHLKEVFRLYRMLFGESCTGCTSKIPQYIDKLKHYDMEVEQDVRKFRLKKGVVISVFGSSRIYSNHNLTDEAAIELLGENIDRKTLFSKLPDNLDELLAGDVTAEPETTKPVSNKPKRKYVRKNPDAPKRKYTKKSK